MRLVTAVSVLLTLVPATGLMAQQPAKCDSTQTIDSCYQQRLNLGAAAVTTTAADIGTSKKATGSAGSNAAGSSTATKDFLPQFASAFSIPGFTGPGKGLDLETNKKLAGISLQLQAVSQEPHVLDALVANMPQKIRAAAKDSITNTLGDLDNVSVSVSANAESGRFGRWSANNAEWISRLTALAISDLSASARAADEDLQRIAGDTAGLASRAGSCIPRLRTLACYTPAQRKLVEAAIDSLVVHEIAASPAVHSALMRTRLDKLEDLLSNQDQMTFKATYAALQRVIGPNVTTVSARWEHGLVNLNSVKNKCGAMSTASCYADYVNNHLSALDHGDRLWVGANLTQSRAYDFALAVDSARVVKPRSLAIEPTVGYGRYFGGSDQRVRADLGVQYRLSDKQSVRQNRWASTLNLTQKLSDQSSAVLSFVWADHTDFVGTTDKKLRANVGLSYKVSKPGS